MVVQTRQRIQVIQHCAGERSKTIEIMHMLKKGQVEKARKGAIKERVKFIAEIFEVAA